MIWMPIFKHSLKLGSGAPKRDVDGRGYERSLHLLPNMGVHLLASMTKFAKVVNVRVLLILRSEHVNFMKLRIFIKMAKLGSEK